MERALASIQKIENIEPIEGADFIEKATVLGWHLVVRKGEFKVGNYGVYFEIDSLLPDLPAFEFLKDPKGRVPAPGFVHRLKTKKLKGIISQGLMMPLDSDFGGKIFSWSEGADVTEALGVKKYEAIQHISLRSGQTKSTFPSFIPKTDEIRVQSIPWIVEVFQGKKIYVTTKVDGTSSTFYLRDGKFGVCSRNQEWKKPLPEPGWRKKVMKFFSTISKWGFGTRIHSVLRRFGYLKPWQRDITNTYWQVAGAFDIERRMKTLGLDNFAIQGEICGPGIQKNRLSLPENELFIFDIYDINGRCYLNYQEQKDVVEKLGLKRVPDVGVFDFNWNSVDEILEAAKGKYPSGHNREGIVIRTIEETSFDKLGRGSFKAINNDYLLTEGD